MMKYLILFLISFSVSANFVKVSEVESGAVTKSFTSIKKCGNDCIRVPDGFNKAFHKKTEIQVLDLDYPTVSKSEVETCADDDACQDDLESKTCADPDEIAVKVLDSDPKEIYCTKTTYPMIGSGKYHVVEDADLKASYEAAQAIKKAKADKRALGAAKRAKCKNALDYVSGFNDANTEAQNDAMEAAFADIQDALVKCRFKKAKRLIGLVTEPTMQTLKVDLLEILN